MLRNLIGLVVTAAASMLPAQQPAPLLLQVTTLGPAAWRARLGPTSFGSMLASQQAEVIWREYADAVDAALQRARGEDEAFGRERARLLGYDGQVQVVAWLEQAEDALHLPRWSAALIAEPDGHTDLAAMADECRGWLDRLGDAASTPWRDLRLSAPQLDKGRMIAVLASAEDAAAAWQRARAWRCEPLAPPAVLRAQFELQPALGLLRDRAVERDLFAALLGPATQRCRVQLGSSGPQLCLDTTVDFGAGDRGVTAGLWPQRQGVPDLDWLVPADGIAAGRVGRADFAALWRGIVVAWAAAADVAVPAFQQRLQRAYDCDIGADVAACLGDETLLLWWRSDAAAADATLLANACLVVPMRDEKALMSKAGALLQRLGALAMPDDDGVLWADLPALGSGTLALGFGVVCLAFGEQARLHIDAVLDRAARGRRRAEAAPLPAAAPPGCNGRGSLDVVNLLAGHLGGVLDLGRSLGLQLPHTGELAAEIERWRPLLRAQRLGEATTLVGTTAAAWQARILW